MTFVRVSLGWSSRMRNGRVKGTYGVRGGIEGRGG